jgi:hypothetical protein
LQACKRVATGLVEATNQRRPLEKKAGIYTSEIIRYSEKYRGAHNFASLFPQKLTLLKSFLTRFFSSLFHSLLQPVKTS